MPYHFYIGGVTVHPPSMMQDWFDLFAMGMGVIRIICCRFHGMIVGKHSFTSMIADDLRVKPTLRGEYYV